jgi:hypothetical protein
MASRENSIMTTYYFQAPTKELLEASLPEFSTPEGDRATVAMIDGIRADLDYIGHMEKTPATYDSEGVEVSPAVLTNDVFANIRCEVDNWLNHEYKTSAPQFPKRRFC